MPDPAPSGITGRVLIAIQQAPRDDQGALAGSPVAVACIPVDDLAAKLDEMTQLARRRARTGVDEGWMQAVRELRRWAKEAR